MNRCGIKLDRCALCGHKVPSALPAPRPLLRGFQVFHLVITDPLGHAFEICVQEVPDTFRMPEALDINGVERTCKMPYRSTQRPRRASRGDMCFTSVVSSNCSNSSIRADPVALVSKGYKRPVESQLTVEVDVKLLNVRCVTKNYRKL